MDKTVMSNSLIFDPHQIFFELANNEGWDRWDVYHVWERRYIHTTCFWRGQV